MNAINRNYIRDIGGRILGYIEEDANGNQECRAWTGKMLGSYDKKTNTTRSWTGRIVSIGNSCPALIYEFNNK